MIQDLNLVYERASGAARCLHFRDFEKIGCFAFFLNFDTVKSSDCSRHYILAWHFGFIEFLVSLTHHISISLDMI